MRKNLFIYMVIIMVLIPIGLIACEKEPAPDPNHVDIESIELESDYLVLLVEETSKLNATISPEDATNKTLIWSTSFDDIIDIDEEGNITAKAPGIATISAGTEGSDISANATIYVGDAIVGVDFDEDTEGFGEKRFDLITDAISAVEDNGVVLVLPGAYGENLVVDKSISLIGINYPILSSVQMTRDDSELRIRGFDFYNQEYPVGGEATIKGAIDGEIHVVDCKFLIDNESAPTGGYAIYASAGTDKVTIKGCTIDNYRYGIYSHKAGATFDVTNNTFTNLLIGIGIDVRVANSNPPINYPAMGEIGDNTFVEVITRAEFFFNGDEYDGNLDFGDYTPLDME